MSRKLLRVVGISSSPSQSGAYALLLNEIGKNRRIPIIIGAHEAQAIAVQIENMKPSRPLTHDLFKALADSFQIEVIEVVIHKFVEGIFYSNLICKKDDGSIAIDSRTSDAVAIALRFNCPIYCEEEVIEQTAINLDEIDEDLDETFEDFEESLEESEEETEESEPKFFMPSGFAKKEQNLDNLTLKELELLLKQLIENEEYEKASLIRDEINKRKNI